MRRSARDRASPRRARRSSPPDNVVGRCVVSSVNDARFPPVGKRGSGGRRTVSRALQLAGIDSGAIELNQSPLICAHVLRLPLREQDQALLPLQAQCRLPDNCSGVKLSSCGPIRHAFGPACPCAPSPTSSRFGQLRGGALAKSTQSRLEIFLFEPHLRLAESRRREVIA
jgi:hypothetical protein